MPDNYLRLAALCCASLLAGCGEDKPAATQVAARVNGAEISVHQVDHLLQRSNVSPDKVKEARGKAIERLIEQEVLVQQAQQDKLDRDPQVLQAMESSRREVLARARLERAAAGVPKPTAEEVRDYYEKHPELFRERRIYTLREVLVQAGQDIVPELQAQSIKAKTLDEVVEWLRVRGTPFATNVSTKPPEQLPPEVAARLHAMKEGQALVLAGADGVLLAQIAEARGAPIEEARAAAMIESFLLNQRRAAAGQQDLQALRARASVEYVGEYAEGVAPPAAGGGAADAGFSKGVAGLK